MCDISLPIGRFSTTLANLIPVSPVVDISATEDGQIRTTITASVAVKIDRFSLMVVAYNIFESGIDSMGIVSF